MRTKEEITSKANEIFEAAKKEFIKSRTCRSFRNCRHNCSISPRKIGRINYCESKTNLEGENGDKLFICDTDEWAVKCQDFKCKNNEEQSNKDFMGIISDPSKCGRVFPKLSALLWVINNGKQQQILTVESTHRHEEEKDSGKETWLQKIKKLFCR